MIGKIVLSTSRRLVNESRKEPKRLHPLSKLALVIFKGLIDDYEKLTKLAKLVSLLRFTHFAQFAVNRYNGISTPSARKPNHELVIWNACPM